VKNFAFYLNFFWVCDHPSFGTIIIMGKISCKRLLVLFLLLGLVAVAFAYGEDKVEEVSTAAKEKAAEAQGAAESVTGWGKEKLETVPKYERFDKPIVLFGFLSFGFHVNVIGLENCRGYYALEFEEQ
jgi:hypothetical protein